MGYTGGKRIDPTYRQLGDHTESLQIDFDPRKIGYARLLEVFWKAHDPTRPGYSHQYVRAVFWHHGEQQELAQRTLAAQAASKGTIRTRIRRLERFYRAEDYHQKYMLRGWPELLAELAASYPAARDLTDSTAAARLNGYLGGFGSRRQLNAEIHRLGLSPAGMQRLRELTASRLSLEG